MRRLVQRRTALRAEPAAGGRCAARPGTRAPCRRAALDAELRACPGSPQHRRHSVGHERIRPRIGGHERERLTSVRWVQLCRSSDQALTGSNDDLDPRLPAPGCVPGSCRPRRRCARVRGGRAPGSGAGLAGQLDGVLHAGVPRYSTAGNCSARCCASWMSTSTPCASASAASCRSPEPVRAGADRGRAVVGQVGDRAAVALDPVAERPAALVRDLARQHVVPVDLVPALGRVPGRSSPARSCARRDREVRRREGTLEDRLGRLAPARAGRPGRGSRERRRPGRTATRGCGPSAGAPAGSCRRTALRRAAA